MRKLATAMAVGALIVGPVVTATAANAASTAPNTTVSVPAPQEPTVKAYDCYGTTGGMGCGPGWTWRDGWRGWACYPC